MYGVKKPYKSVCIAVEHKESSLIPASFFMYIDLGYLTSVSINIAIQLRKLVIAIVSVVLLLQQANAHDD